ncbi:hypothetical protein BD289DRAFT_441716 [Coniella lustricola]|uniref:Methyltransferase type 11 domain-containing protein n=1 Tax=Coniella lustricola TaxID=2025994 RepID=A0A2T2ZZ33_9PEZI|nr:hypothetical protein BD289DRAFT_441716 [Coniella lustricola]
MRRVLKPGGFLAARDAASLTWFPYTSELHRCMTQRMFAALGTPDAAVGGKMKGLLRASGWDVSDEAMAQGRFVAGAGTTIVTGQDKCRWWRDSMGGRLRPGEQFREGWVKAGLSEEQCDEAREWLDRWAEAEDAWYGALQSEVLIWK